MADYFSETFALMSVAYAASHAEEPAGPGPIYEGLSLEDALRLKSAEDPLSPEEESLLLLSHDAFETYVRESVLGILKAEAAEAYVPEETDGVNSYSAINGDDVWRMMEVDSVDFFRGGEALGVPGLVAAMNEEGGLDQEILNASVAVRLASPAGGYERAFEKHARLEHIIQAYVKAHPSEEFNGQHYRDLISAVKMVAAEAEAERRRMEVMEYVRGRMVELGMDLSESPVSASSSSA
jgi:hypothetical protein